MTMQRNKVAIVVLHEIYGVNNFIKAICQEFEKDGYVVFCPNLIKKEAFTYQEEELSYAYFREQIGYHVSSMLENQIVELKKDYKKVFVLGFSAGATLAWNCCELESCDGIISIYGSRIRDYQYRKPKCPVLLVFSNNEANFVPRLMEKANEEKGIHLHVLDAHHGYMDPYASHYHKEARSKTKQLIDRFLNENTY